MKAYSTLLIGFGSMLFACGGSGGGTGGSGGTGATSTHAVTTATGSTTTVTSGGPTTTTTTSTGSGPIACSGTETSIHGAECDILQQNCTNDKTCVPVDNGSGGAGMLSTACQGNAGLKAVASPCASDTECQKGLFCFFDVCTPPCCPDAGSNSCMGGQCNLKISLQAPHDQDFYYVCTFAPQCTLFDVNSCATGYGCYPDNGPGLMTCSQTKTPPVPEGGACNAVNDCETMTACVDTPGVCRIMCDPAGSAMPPKQGGCPANETCKPTNLGTFGMTGLCMP